MRKLALIIAIVCLMVCGPQSAHAQLSRLDLGQLIEGLRQEGLRDLLRHLVDTEPTTDPVIRQQVLISMSLLDYEDFAAAGQVEAATAALESALDETRKLINENYTHEQRPIWQTQLGEMLMFQYLESLKTNASQFYSLGVPTKEQAEAYEKAIPEALEAMEDADVRFFQLQTELPKEPDHVEKRVNTGMWARMMVEYYAIRTKYSLSRASYFAGLLPDTNPYFANLGNNPRIVRQRKDIPGERVRLLNLASQELEQMLSSPNDDWSIHSRCRTLLGCVLLARTKNDEAIDQLDRAIRANEGDLNQLTAQFAKAYALDASGKVSQAMDVLTEARSHPVVSQNLLMRLLLSDVRHRIALRNAQKEPAEKRAVAVAQAYQPYLDLLADPEISASADALRNYIHKRWVNKLPPGANLADVPSVVVSAMGEMLRVEGQNLAIEAGQTGSAEQMKEARDKLNRAIEVNTGLITRRDVTPGVAAAAIFNQGMATYFLDVSNFPQVAKAAGILTDGAEKYPDQAVSETGISYAIEMLRQIHASGASVEGVHDAYHRTANVLLDKFPTIPAADNDRFYYVYHYLIPGRKWQEAADILAKIPFGHANYFVGQRERLYCLVELYKLNPSEELAQQAITEAQRVRGEAERAADGTDDPAAQAIIRNTLGHARIVLSEMASLTGDMEQAIVYLNNFEQDFLSDTELLRQGLGKRIGLLARAGKFDAAGVEAGRMMKTFPDDAAPVIDRVLTDLDAQATALREQAAKELVERRKQELTGMATSMSRTAAKMAQLLVDWAAGEGYDEDQMVPFKLIMAKSLRTADNAKASLEILRPIHKNYSNDADVIHELAETLYAIGGRENNIEAAEFYKAIIAGLRPDANGLYPARYWNAWMRYFQIADKLNENTNIITLRVRSLRNSDPNLGGEPYNSELERLAVKHAQ